MADICCNPYRVTNLHEIPSARKKSAKDLFSARRIDTPTPTRCRNIFQHFGGLCLISLLLAFHSTSAHADCSFDKRTPSPVNFTPPSTITIPFNLTTNTVIGTPVSAMPSNPPIITCTNGTPYGVQNLVGGAPTGGSNYIYPTAISGLGYQLIHADSPSSFMGPYPTYTTTGGTFKYRVGSTLQLVQTGPIANGSVLPAGTFANWQWGSIVPEYFVLTNSITFVASACNVSSTSLNVTLPTVATSAFSGKDSTAGPTPFDITMTCPSGSTATLAIMFTASSGVPAGYNNVLMSTGSATGLGVELRDGSANTVVFGKTTVVGTTPSGMLSIPYTAQYHAISNSVTPGGVAATATFTLSYQ